MEGFTASSLHSITQVFSPVYSASSTCQILRKTLFFKIPAFVIQEAQVYFGQEVLNSLHLLCQKMQHTGQMRRPKQIPGFADVKFDLTGSDFSKLTP